MCPRQFTGNLACADGPAPLCGPRRHWPPSVGTAAAPGPQAPARRPRLYRGRPAPPGRAWPPARRSLLADRLSPRRHGPQPRGRGAAQPQREKPSKCAARRAPPPRPPRRPAALLTPLLPQLRKPVVEKMRRDRINSSIEQLKLLLEQEFARHQPNSKLEKADILEMAVSYLKHSKGEPARPRPRRAAPRPAPRRAHRRPSPHSLRRRRRPQEPAPGLQRGLLVVPAGGRAVPDAARGQRHADEAALPLSATLGRARRPHQGAQGVGAHPGQGQRRCAPALLRPLAALVTRRDVRAAAPGPEGQPCVPLARREALPGSAPPGLGPPLLSEGSLQAGGPAVGSF